jgi:hypothetical protein
VRDPADEVAESAVEDDDLAAASVPDGPPAEQPVSASSATANETTAPRVL